MCGICLVVSENLMHKEADMFKRLLWLNQWRGIDSTGVCVIEEPSKKANKELRATGHLPYKTIKEAIDAQFFLSSKTVDKIIQASSPWKRAMIGHTRAATIGDVNDDNAHPFVFDNLVGVVNGTVQKYKIKDGKDFETDSEALLSVLDKEGIRPGLEEIMSYDFAPFTMVLFDKKDNSIKIARNGTDTDYRPLWFARSKDNKTLIGSSDPAMIGFAGNQLKYDFDMTYGYQTPKRGMLTTIPLLGDKFLSEIKLERIAPKERPKTVIRYWERDKDKTVQINPITNSPYIGGDRGFVGNVSSKRNKQTSASWQDFSETIKAKTSNWPVKGQINHAKAKVYYGPEGRMLSFPEFSKYSNDGCCCCTNTIDPSEKDIDKKIAWSKSDAGWEIICEECSGLDWVRDFFLTYEFKSDVDINTAE